MDHTSPTIDAGTAYSMKPSTYDASLTEVRRGTPMGELLRRYWHPIAKCEEATDTPKIVRVLGEELILFRDKTGRPGLVYPRCSHRGTTLYYGKVEERGIRCCYHGWLFDTQGNCLEQPCEPGGGKNLERARQPWYPVQEKYGLIFAYMGPSEKKPVLPLYDNLEALGPDEEIVAEQKAFAPGGPIIAPCNWLQYFENGVDVYHVYILHSNFSTVQFAEELASFPEVKWEYTPHGLQAIRDLPQKDGGTLRRVTEFLGPVVRSIPDVFAQPGPSERIEWILPVDDTHFTTFSAGRVPKGQGKIRTRKALHNGKLYDEMTEEEHQKYPNDYEAQVGQGPITFHSEEHLVTSDKGVGMYRRQLQNALKAIAEGRDPDGVSFGNDMMVKVGAGNFFLNK